MINPVELTSKLISFKSITPIDDGAIDYLSELLTDLGFNVIVKEFGDNKIKNLYARYGSKAPNLCFAGHTDVVPVGDEKAWSVDPFAGVIKEGMLIGRGVVDMKGAVACFISAAKDFIDSNKDFGSISLLITGDEEGEATDGTVKMLKTLQKDELTHCIVGEPTNPTKLGEMLKVGRRGSATFSIEVKGVQGHVAYPHLADNPITKLVCILNELKAQKLDDGNENFQPSNLEIVNIDVGNSASNVIPAKAAAKINIRFNDIHTAKSLKDFITKVCEKHAGKNFTIGEYNNAESFITKNKDFVDTMVKSIIEVVGMTPEISTSGGTSDARFIKDYCPVLEFGLINSTAHKVDEKVNIKDIENLKKIYYALISNYFKG